ncbi:MAG: hypothetical protein ABR881_02155 [Candidatus Sulfotelmatobacter sp.]|jgi:hypothetical protein
MNEPEHSNLAQAMKSSKQGVARRLALRAADSFWQSRCYDFNVWSERKFVEKLRYIHRNPVKRGLVARPEDWPWSSFLHYATGQAGVVEIESQWTAAGTCWNLSHAEDASRSRKAPPQAKLGRGTLEGKLGWAIRHECPAFENREGWGSQCYERPSKKQKVGQPPVYRGDANNAGSTSAILNQVVKGNYQRGHTHFVSKSVNPRPGSDVHRNDYLADGHSNRASDLHGGDDGIGNGATQRRESNVHHFDVAPGLNHGQGNL